jgi:hypothetical protein
MRSVRRAVDAVPLVVCADAQGFKQAGPSPTFRPSVESVEHGLPWTEVSWEIAPRHPCASPPKHPLDEEAVVLARAPAPTTFKVDDAFESLPLRIGELSSDRHPYVRSFFRSVGQFSAEQSSK